MSRAPLPPINFTALADALLAQAEHLVGLWLAGGRRNGHEWVCGSLHGGEGTSCSVNLNTGRWADFATGEQGGDLVSLYAAVHGLTMGKAAVAVARETGLEDVAGVQPEAPGTDKLAPPPRPPAPPPKPKPARDSWTTVMPVPAHAPQATFWHPHRTPDAIEHTATYEIDGALYGYVVRFRTSDGGKDTLPYTWCQSARDGACKWHWKTWDEPRPLYLPGHQSPGVGQTVVLVEGEKKADTLHALLHAAMPGVYCVATWPGGCKAWRKADWHWLYERPLLLWPDCDGKREALTKADRDAAADDAALVLLQQAKPILPADKQPGMAAMVGIGQLLAGHGAKPMLLQIPEPGTVADGWDCGDAIARDGWDADRVLAFLGGAQPLPMDSDAPTAADEGGDGGQKLREGLAEAGDGGDAFAEHLEWMCQKLKLKTHELTVNRSLLIAALRKATLLHDCLGFDELRNAPCTRVPWPWRSEAGPLADADALRLGDWIVQTYKLRSASLAALTEAMDTVADERRFHPIRDWLQGLQWDGKARRERWLIYVMGLHPDKLSPRRRRYLELVGGYILDGMVRRVMEPGCKFDYSPVIEGVPGVGKSTFIEVLVGKDFFSDTHFDIGDGSTRGMEQLEGLWAYELSELTAFKRADSEQIKQFFSSTVDRFRGAYGRFVQPHPRQCVIFCTTNKRVYLYDLTGNRRFWPLWIGQPINLDWLKKWRLQLFAEAFARYRANERYYPTREEEEAYFVPEQRKRLVETAVQSRLYELLTREGAPGGEGRLSADINQLCKFVTLTQLVAALGSDPSKSTSLLESQIRGWLESHGWEACREGGGQRRRGYRQPAVWPPTVDEDDESDMPLMGSVNSGPPAQAGPSTGSNDEPF